MGLQKGSRGWRGRARKWGSRKRAEDVEGKQGSGTAERQPRIERESKEVWAAEREPRLEREIKEVV